MQQGYETGADQHPAESTLQISLYKAFENGIMPIIEVEEVRLIAAAKDLEKEFRDRKKSLHQHLVEGYDKQERKRPASFYSKIQLFTKHRRGTLQIFWQDVHQTKAGNAPAFVYLRRTSKDGYNIRALQTRATYAAELVGEFELRAQTIRKLWRDLMEVKRACRNSLLRLPSGVAALSAQSELHDGYIVGAQDRLRSQDGLD